MSQKLTANDSSRRSFLQGSTAAIVGGGVAASVGTAQAVHQDGGGTIRVGLIGCGGRGRGAARDASLAGKDVKLVAVADAFEDSLDNGRKALQASLGDQYDVAEDQAFFGFDAYKRLLETNVDVVLLCTPPHFRPMQLKAAIAAGKHVFCEKPVAVDPTGVRDVLKTVVEAKKKNLSIVSGLCWRYDLGVRETMKRIQDGAIGEIQAIQENYLTGTLWEKPRKANWSEMEFQLRNWLYYTWLSGDHIVEQHIHSLDKSLWLMNDQPPKQCFGLGGRQVRTEKKWGNVYDHFAICYEWANGVKTFAYTRQMKDCATDVDDYVIGTKGKALLLGTRRRPRVENSAGAWRYRGPRPSMYQVEHRELFEGIRKGEPINNGVYMSYSTMMAIMGREACYTGDLVTWDAMMKSNLDLSPTRYEWGDVPFPSVALPGKTKLDRSA